MLSFNGLERSKKKINFFCYIYYEIKFINIRFIRLYQLNQLIFTLIIYYVYKLGQNRVDYLKSYSSHNNEAKIISFWHHSRQHLAGKIDQPYYLFPPYLLLLYIIIIIIFLLYIQFIQILFVNLNDHFGYFSCMTKNYA